MRRFAHCLILVLAPSSVAWADDAFNQSQRGACVYSEATPNKAINTPARAPARVDTASAHAPRDGSRHSEASGGGGSEDDLMQRMRAPRWHSFLPGMFR
ncbi:MAG: hypothetical protein ACI4NW_00495 [Stenotrophomonas sp.]